MNSSSKWQPPAIPDKYVLPSRAATRFRRRVIHALSWVVESIRIGRPGWIRRCRTGAAGGAHDAAGGDRAGAGGKAKSLTPYVPNKGERIAARVENILTGEGRHAPPVLRLGVFRRRLRLRGGLPAAREPVQLRGRPGQLFAQTTTSAPKSSSSPRGSSTAAAICRSSAAGATRPQVKFFGLGIDSRERRPRELRLPASEPSATPDALADTAISAGSRRLRVDEMVAGTSGRPLSLHRGRSIDNANLPGVDARCDIPAHAGHGRLRLAHVARVFATRGLLRDHRARLRRHGKTGSASSRSTTKPSSTFRSCVRPGCSPSARSPRRRNDKERSEDAVLHAALSRRQLLASRLSRACASAIRTACSSRESGASWRAGSSIQRCSTMQGRSPRAAPISTSTG